MSETESVVKKEAKAYAKIIFDLTHLMNQF